MTPQEILNFCLKRGLLLDEEVLKIFSTFDSESAKVIIEKIHSYTQQKIITKNVFNENKEKVIEIFSAFPDNKQKNFEKLKIKLGLELEISKEVSSIVQKSKEFDINKIDDKHRIKIDNLTPVFKKKLGVEDFVDYYKNRLNEMKTFLQTHSNLKDLISINKISGRKYNFSLIGIVSDKWITKNKNILMELEDVTGKIRVLVNQNKPDLYKVAEEISLDSVIGLNVSGNSEIVFVNDIVFPDSVLLKRKKSLFDEYALFISDLHLGSKLFLEKNFLRFIDYLNGKVPNTNKDEINKIKYLFIVGDLVASIGIYPNQEKDLAIDNLEEQFSKAAELLSKIREDIAIIISPGNHDCVRLMEPQPILDEKYAWPIFNLKNVFLTGNPSYVNIGAKENFSGFDVLTYHGFSFPYYADTIPSLIKENAINSPEKIMAYLLKNRHLAPTHKAVQHAPSEKDNLIIRKIPDIFVSGHIHKSAISYYNNILMISGSCWENITSFQEKLGNKPDFCKVPMINLKTRAIKILDFE